MDNIKVHKSQKELNSGRPLCKTNYKTVKFVHFDVTAFSSQTLLLYSVCGTTVFFLKYTFSWQLASS
jgi:hypothetical protein